MRKQISLCWCWTAGAGVSPFDQDLVHILRRTDKPVFYLINKIENNRQREALSEFFVLGMERFFPVSAEHGVGIPTFMEELVAVLTDETLFEQYDQGQEDTEKREICIAVAGRPNVGKSSLINRSVR